MAAVVKHVIHNPAAAVAKVVHNPTAAILPKNVRSSTAWHKIGRPVVKIGAAAVLGAVTGGIGIGAAGVTFSGLSVAGAAGASAASALGGGLNDKAFKPVQNAIIPAAAGFGAGNAWRAVAKQGGSALLKAGANKVIDAAKAGAGKVQAQAVQAVAKATDPATLMKKAGTMAGTAAAKALQPKAAQPVAVMQSAAPAARQPVAITATGQPVAAKPAANGAAIAAALIAAKLLIFT